MVRVYFTLLYVRKSKLTPPEFVCFFLTETKLWQDEMPVRLNMLKSKHILQEKRAE